MWISGLRYFGIIMRSLSREACVKNNQMNTIQEDGGYVVGRSIHLFSVPVGSRGKGSNSQVWPASQRFSNHSFSLVRG